MSHSKLVEKLEMAGIVGRVKTWIKDWLSGRKQRVKVEGTFSDWIDVLSSVVQGSVLGGTLFDIFIDDIRKVVLDALIKMFADDTKVALEIGNTEDAKKMQSIIDNLVEWAKRWGMTFNEAKCRIIHAGNNNPRTAYFMNGRKIEEAEEEKDLGVWVTSSMKPAKQCSVAAKNANFALGQMLRAFHYRKKTCVIPLYKCFIRPKLEFAVAAWSPWTETDRKVLEKVQERMIRQLCDARGHTYEEKLKDVGLTTLTERRERGDAIETFKTIKGFNRVLKENWFEFEAEDQRPTRRNTEITEEGERRKSNVLREERARLEVRKNSFTVRAAKTWNRIPDQVREKTSVNAFKNAYDKWKEESRV